MISKKRVILITDGDESAKAAVRLAAEELDCSVVNESGGNPTRLSGEEIIKVILSAKKEPVLVMFDDCGHAEAGPGEIALKRVVESTEIEVLGAVAVASQSFSHEWTKVDVSINRNGDLTEYGVDKDGIDGLEIGRIRGDTVYSLDELSLPIVVGVGDLGKMGGHDVIERGAPITKQAIELILERSGHIE
ncbi:stage V sporulation protein AE [Bacillus shivajii]|uniref:stage V sporulation protein AE n=1 Tax=Bacillus shivajii TaxID=1983719 RepID=UPI001CFB3D86|nr:stage V sporulation protein AE [Bacillus shivajii]UCZ54701.1 stage V sporulation protein AE [Bacillus shivajii]